MARQRRSPERLRRFADEHLLYEAGMLYAVTGKLMNRQHSDDPVAQNALLESFGIHNRNLIDFLWLDQPMKPTDTIARDWVADWRPPEMSERLQNVKNRVGKEMVHLSYNRLDVPDDERGWTVLGVGPEVIERSQSSRSRFRTIWSRSAGETERTPRPARCRPIGYTS